VTGRVLAGTTQRIEIPLQNIDPNGDSVRLLGLGSGPKLGRILAVGATYLEYEAFPKMAGTDTFTYLVIDAYGAKASGDIRVGVVPAGISNTEPTANQDVVTTRPGRTVYIQPLANDSDPDGDKISLDPDNPVSFPGLTATVVDTSAIEVVVPNEPGTWFGTYKIRDARGAMAVGNIVITYGCKTIAHLKPRAKGFGMCKVKNEHQCKASQALREYNLRLKQREIADRRGIPLVAHIEPITHSPYIPH